MVELCTHLAIERARLVTSHLKSARLISIPTNRAILGNRKARDPPQPLLFRQARYGDAVLRED
jgi:hypothetical protein